MLIDTHAHLFWPGLSEEIDAVVARSQEAGVEKIIVPGTDVASSKRAVELARTYPGLIYAAVGIHPEEATTSSANLESIIKENREWVVAIGEVGMDFYGEEMKKTASEQAALFEAQIKLASTYHLPLIIHTRESVPATLTILDKYQGQVRGQFHCFGGTEEELAQILKRDFYVSFCGNVSWSKRVRKMTTLVPSDRLLLETDSPFMTPVNEAGDKVSVQNEPANVRITAQIIASARSTSLADLEQVTRDNTRRLFDI